MTDQNSNVPTDDPTPEPEGQPAGTPAVAQNSDSPASDPLMVPKTRFDEVNERYKAIVKQQEEAAAQAAAADKERLEKQQKFQELYEASQKELEALKSTVKQNDYDNLRRDVATEAGYPHLWNRLQGEDKEALTADAETLFKDLAPPQKKDAPNYNAGTGNGANNRQSPTPALTPAEIIEQAHRTGVSPHFLAQQYNVTLTTQ